MKLYKLIGWSSALCLCAMPLQAQTANEVEQLKKQVRQLQDNFEKIQRDQSAQIEALKRQIESLQQPSAKSPPPAAAADVAKSPVGAATAAPPVDLTPRWSPAEGLRIGGSKSYLDISFDALFAAGGSTSPNIGTLQQGGHDPTQRGFTVQNLELTLAGNVDPYFRGQANLVYQINPQGQSTFEAEEAYLESLSLPGNFQLKAGQFFTEFGRLNATHPHTWTFVDQPLVNSRMFGGDGLRNPGARLSWLLPTPFYSELFFTVQNSQGETAHSFRNDNGGAPLFGRLATQRPVTSFGDMLFTPRYAVSFDLTDNQVLLAGASAAFGPNGSGPHAGTQIYGVDWFWKWKSPHHHGGFPFVSWQTEAMLRRYQAGAFNWDLNGNGVLDAGEKDLNGDGVPDVLPRETLRDYGFYSQLAYGFKPGWVAALRGDYLTSATANYERVFGRDLDRAGRWRLSPNLTWFPSEFSKIRLQYNYDHRSDIGTDHSLWLQFEFMLGAHGAHKF